MSKTSKLKAKDPKAAEPSKPKILIFGSYGVSKTWGALSFPNCYFIDTEGGANLKEYTDRLKASGGVYMGPEDGACDMEEIIEQVIALATEKHKYKTLVIDSITKPFNNEVTKEAERLGDKNGFGADKKPAIALMKRLIMWLDRLDMNVIMIAREKIEWLKGEQVGMEPDVWNQTNYELHLVLRISKQGNKRIAKVTKSRIRAFADGEVIDWTLSNAVSDTTARDEFIKRMGEGIMDDAKTIQLATEAEVADVKKYTDLLKTPADDISKWFEKAKVTKWEEMDTETINKVITFLKDKLKTV